jgi:hypothetical protein
MRSTTKLVETTGQLEMRIEIARNQIDRQLINDDNATHQSTEHTGECGRRRDVAQRPNQANFTSAE